jgi:hypothetical protein
VTTYLELSKFKTRVTTNIKELITRVTSDRVYRDIDMEWIDSIDTELILGYIILIGGMGILLYMIREIWND